MLRHFGRILMLTLTVSLSFLSFISKATYEVYPFPSGSWMRYEFYAKTNATSQKSISFVEETNQIAWSKFEIQKTFGTYATILRTTKFRNETQVTTTHTVDVRTGEGLPLPVIIASNLKAGDKIFEGAGFSISRTEYMDYLGLTRNVNYALHEKTGPLGPDYYYEVAQFFWDKETGILCEMQTLIYERYEPSEGKAVKEYTLWKMVLVEVSPKIMEIWEVADNPAIYILLILFAVLIFLIGTFLWKKG